MQNIEGHVPVPGGNVWYKVCGYANSNSAPLIVIHGGPGYPHDYLEPLLDLSSERPVIFYDQLGCGNSDDVTDTTLWTPEHFRDELEHVVSTLELDEYHILGHSWGAAVAVSFAITRPTGLHSLILSDPYISTAVWNDDATRLMKLLETHVHERLEGTPDKTAEYKAALKEYYRRFIYRTDHYPEACRRADKKMNADVYKYMWGRNELKITGTLKDFDQTSGLSEIDVPVLLVCGRHDEATPEACELFKSKLATAELMVFESSAHFPFWSQREEYIAAIQGFLCKQDRT